MFQCWEACLTFTLKESIILIVLWKRTLGLLMCYGGLKIKIQIIECAKCESVIENCLLVVLWVTSQTFLPSVSSTSLQAPQQTPLCDMPWALCFPLLYLCISSFSHWFLFLSRCQQGTGLGLGFHTFQIRSCKHSTSTVLQLHKIAPPPSPYFSSGPLSQTAKHVVPTYLVNISKANITT